MPTETQRTRGEGGFSLLELLLAMLIAIEVLVAGGMAFDLHNRMAVIQTQLTDLQQSLRISQYDIARLVRMAGRGGLPPDIHPEAVFDPGATIPALGGQAIEVRDNVTDATDRNIARGDADSPKALDGTDILTVRGCFANSVYQLQPNAFVAVDSDNDQVADGSVTFTINDQSVAGIHQPLDTLIEQLGVANSTPTMIFVSPVSRQTYGVGRVTSFSPTSGNPNQVQITVSLDTNSPLNPSDSPQRAVQRRRPRRPAQHDGRPDLPARGVPLLHPRGARDPGQHGDAAAAPVDAGPLRAGHREPLRQRPGQLLPRSGRRRLRPPSRARLRQRLPGHRSEHPRLLRRRHELRRRRRHDLRGRGGLERPRPGRLAVQLARRRSERHPVPDARIHRKVRQQGT